MTTSPGLRRPPGRYDAPRTLPRPVLLGGAGVLALALLVFSYVAYAHYASSRASFTLLGYDVRSDTSVRVTFSLDLAEGDTARCLLRARGRDNDEVGSATLTLRGRARHPFTVVQSLTTTRRAVVGEVLSCSRT